MIDILRKKFIRISMLSVAIVLMVIYGIIGLINVRQLNERADIYTALIADNGGKFPKWDRMPKRGDEKGRRLDEGRHLLTPESEASTRFFIVRGEERGKISEINIDAISSITEIEAREYAEEVLQRNGERGWISYYRYKVCERAGKWEIVFVDEQMSRTMTLNFMLVLGGVFLGSMLCIWGLIVLFSKRAVKPVAESYQKQKQFVTDANHELKTPLTLILTNLEILEAELGKNEWLEDMRAEGNRMAELVNQLVSLSKMDEAGEIQEKEKMDLSQMLSDILIEFQGLAEQKGKHLLWNLESEIWYEGEKERILQLYYILLDNALKYCDEDGTIRVSLKKKRNIILQVENSFSQVEETEFAKLFDRFYRADKARTSGESFGIGLSIAKGIVEKHKGEIRAYQRVPGEITFEVILKNKIGIFR